MEDSPSTFNDDRSDRRQGGRRMTDKQLEEIADLRKDMRRYMSQNDKKMASGQDQFIAIMREIAQLNKAIQTLDENTKDMIKTYRDYQAAARVGSALQKLVIACAKWGGILGALGYGINWLLTHFTEQTPPR